MKNLKIFTAVVALAFLSLSFTNTVENKDELHQQIVKLIGKTTKKIANEDLKTEVTITLNDKSEIVVISVKSDNESVQSFVKSKLNYKKVKVKALNPGKMYRVPLTFLNE